MSSTRMTRNNIPKEDKSLMSSTRMLSAQSVKHMKILQKHQSTDATNMLDMHDYAMEKVRTKCELAKSNVLSNIKNKSRIIKNILNCL